MTFMRMAGLAFSLCVFSTFLNGQSAPPEKHPFSANDWAVLHSAASVAVTPDGSTILYRVGFGAQKGRSTQEWHTIHTDGSSAKKLDLPADFTPFGFTASGSGLYGSFKINNLGQFAVFQVDGVTAHSQPQMTVLLPRGIQSAVPSPDGARYAILADPRPVDDLNETRTVIEPDQVSVYVVKSDGTAGQWWCPDLKYVASGPLTGGNPSIAWSPRDGSLAVLSTTPKIGFHYVRSYIDSCTAWGSHRLAEIPNSASGLAWINNGSELAFISTTTPVLTPDELYTIPASGGKMVDRTPNLDGTVVALDADPRGHLWVAVDRGVRIEVMECHGNELAPAYRWNDGFIADPPVFSPYTSATPQLAFTVGDPTHANNVAVPQSCGLHKITYEGDDTLAKISLGPVHEVHWTSKEGIALEGIVTFPAGYAEGKKYPYLVFPHGGPEANDLFALDPVARAIAGLGYVVLQPEYRGSTGYGDKFLSAIYQHFGDRAYRDVDSGTDYAIGQGWADPNRLAIFGWSAGGFMTSWTVTQTNRYKAAIEGAGITDWASFIWTSDVQQIDYDARWPSEDPEAFTSFSAVDFSDKVTTPILVLHGGADHRVPTYQGREFFESLAAHGKKTRMVEYPGSPHFPVLWEQRLNVFQEISDWLKKYNP